MVTKKQHEDMAKVLGHTYKPYGAQEPDPLPLGQITVTRKLNAGLYMLEVTNPPTKQAEDILLEVLPDVLQLFLEKNRDYGDDPEGRLGPKAQFIDMYRKMKKLKRGLWEGQPLVGEQPDEIIKDLIGHGLLALLDMKHGKS